MESVRNRLTGGGWGAQGKETCAPFLQELTVENIALVIRAQPMKRDPDLANDFHTIAREDITKAFEFIADLKLHFESHREKEYIKFIRRDIELLEYLKYINFYTSTMLQEIDNAEED
jgi:hypothetical protein